MTIDLSEAFDVAVIGGGSAGMAVACAASEAGSCRVIVLEREGYLGGVLPQCVHDGFGLYLYGESLTGPEYARRWIDRVSADGVFVALDTTVIGIGKSEGGLFSVEAVGKAIGGHAVISARAVVCATGCRERTRGAMQIPGSRPAGVLTAGSAQYMVNVANQMPGDKAVILGSGDIGLIMARRMVLEGAEVRMVLGQEATGLVRNHIRCIQDFGIPIRYGWGLVSVHGRGQLKGVTVAPISEDGSFDLSAKEYVRCNVLLIACGLIPEREVLSAFDDVEHVPGLFICGNANVPHDLVDQVSQEGLAAGLAAAAHARKAVGVTSEALVLPNDLGVMARKRISEPKGRMSELSTPLEAGAQRVVCTVCPSGCVMTVNEDGSVSGNTCERGEAFGRAEAACPTRLFTGTVKIAGAGKRRLLPVRTQAPVPKALLGDIAKKCRRLGVSAPVAKGQVLVEDICASGAALVASDECAGEL